MRFFSYLPSTKMEKYSYKTISNPGEGFYKDKGSKFIGQAFPVSSEEDCKARLEAVKQAHPKARHHCFAYRLGIDKNNFRAYDDGEPSGTAGRPILGQIDHYRLTHVLVVVVRYFGGTLLGVRGLIDAYQGAARAALQAATFITKELEKEFVLFFDYPLMKEVLQLLKRHECEITHRKMEQTCAFTINIPLKNLKSCLKDFDKIPLLKIKAQES